MGREHHLDLGLGTLTNWAVCMTLEKPLTCQNLVSLRSLCLLWALNQYDNE